MISTILCNYNYDQFIGQAIESVLAQTYDNFELIIIDDGSTDNSREIITTYTDSRIKTIFKENGGQASAFNEGFKLCQGEIISFLDSDDWWQPEKLETIVKWHNFLDGQYSILQHNLEIWSTQSQGLYKLILPVGDCSAEMKKTKRIDFFVPTSGLSFPRIILDKIFPIPSQFIICADAYLMRTAFIFGNVYSIPISLGFYRKHNNTVYKNKSFNHNQFFENNLYPSLNNFYLQQKFDYQFKIQQKSSGEKRWFTQIKGRVKKMLKSI